MTMVDADNIHAARLEAVFTLLAGANTDEEYAAAQEQAAAILDMSDDEVLALGEEPEPELAQHAREATVPYLKPRGDFLTPMRYAATAVADEPEDDESEDLTGAKALAEFYAESYTLLASVGSAPTDVDLEAVRGELEPLGWTVEPGEEGEYQAVSLGESAGTVEVPSQHKRQLNCEWRKIGTRAEITGILKSYGLSSTEVARGIELIDNMLAVD